MASASNYGVLSLVTPPKLKLVDQPSLIKFETEYAAYKTKVHDINKDREDANHVHCASMKDCMDPATLHALCVIGEIQNADKVEDATAEAMKAWFENAPNLAPKDLSERIDSALLSVNYEATSEDPAGGVTNFVINVITALDQNNASEVRNDQDLAKHFIDRMVRKMNDPVLQERIQMRRRGGTKSQLADIKFFKNEVASLAVDLALTEIARQRVKPRQGRVTRNHKKNSNTSTVSPKHEKTRRGFKRNESDWTNRCLNPDCDGHHRLKVCPNTTTELRKELFEAHYKSKESKKPKAVKSVSTPDASQAQADQGRFRIMIEDTVMETVLGDSGSDFNAISSSTFSQVKAAKPSIKVESFSEPLELVGAFKTDKAKFTSSARVKLTFTIYLPGSNVPVGVRGVDFIIVDDEMDEILLGRPFLKAIGFDLNDHLHKIHKFIHEKHFDDINSDHVRLAAAQYKGLAYMAAEDDPIELPECIAAGIGNDSEESINNAFTKILLEAKENGISADGYERIDSTLKEYRNVFRIKLGCDPPADVPPVVQHTTALVCLIPHY